MQKNKILPTAFMDMLINDTLIFDYNYLKLMDHNQEQRLFYHLTPHNSNEYDYYQPQLRYTYSGISNTSSNTEFLLQSARSFNEDFDKPMFLGADEFVNSITKTVQSLKTRMNLHQDLVTYLLYLYRWNEEKLEEQYYTKYAEIYKYKNQHLDFEKAQQFGPCSVCLQESARLIQHNLCSHRYCYKCWKEYIKTNLENNQIFFNCMNNCEASPVLKGFIQKNFPQLNELFLKRLGMKYCLANSNITYCPSQKCSLFCQKPLLTLQQKVQCLCGTVYCFQCRKQPHIPLSCSDIEKWEDIINKESKNLDWINKNTKKCPKCRVMVQKSIGCDHMRCVCGCQFCFICCQLWDEKHAKGIQNCPKFQNLHIKKQLSSQEKQFIKMYENIIQISRRNQRDIDILNECMSSVTEKIIVDKLQGLRNELSAAWRIQKWCKIGSFMFSSGKSFEIDMQKDFTESITNLVNCIQTIRKNHNKTTPKQLAAQIEELRIKHETMLKCQSVFLQVWRNTH